MIAIIRGPHGCNQPRVRNQLLHHFNSLRIVDDWGTHDERKIKDGDVVLTNLSPEECKSAANFPRANVFFYDFEEIKNELTEVSHGLRK